MWALLKFNRASPCLWAQHSTVCCRQVPGSFLYLHENIPFLSLHVEPSGSLLLGERGCRLSCGKSSSWVGDLEGALSRSEQGFAQTSSLEVMDGKSPAEQSSARLSAARYLLELLGQEGQCLWPCES